MRPAFTRQRAILVDVDGTLAGPYHLGRRSVRASARTALEMLSQRALVFLWSVAGADNGRRLLQEFPELRPYVSGCLDKDREVLAQFDRPVCIDDDDLDLAVKECDHVILGESYNGGNDTQSLLEAVRLVIEWLDGSR